ncbi:hypothetical protein GCM10009850_036880 [Nonomuraea monospora]|uniref:Uncharacterized protein n=1 Tax=Nonomuraea monospora TaxID=568818 RepID=A0ABN3CFS9_9ACTN
MERPRRCSLIGGARVVGAGPPGEWTGAGIAALPEAVIVAVPVGRPMRGGASCLYEVRDAGY